jgi:uncharacterized FlgJ-related protein
MVGQVHLLKKRIKSIKKNKYICIHAIFEMIIKEIKKIIMERKFLKYTNMNQSTYKVQVDRICYQVGPSHYPSMLSC